MVNLLDFTDRGIMVVLRADGEASFPDSITIMTKSKFFSNEAYSKIVMMPDGIMIPIKETLLDKVNVAVLGVSNKTDSIIGYMHISLDLINKEERLSKIYKKHKSKLTSGAIEEIKKELQKDLMAFNQYNLNRGYNTLLISYDGNILKHQFNVTQSEIFKLYNDANIKRIFPVAIKEELSDEEKMSHYTIASRLMNAKKNILLEVIKRNYKVNDFEEIVEVDFNGRKELYNKQKLLEELVNDYTRKDLNSLISKLLREWVGEVV